ncbi:MAG TPA: prepilin peptidase [Gemmatimonadales bacterium]|nr:prepilin peptidase [Gemmatimonadales bacterium]
MDADLLVGGIFGALGLLFGSFLNVCILRLPKQESIVSPPSHCPGCGAGIAWYDNIPVLSWLMLRGRCRHCRTAISPLYPTIELTTGLIWFACGFHWGITLAALKAVVFFTILLGITMTDAREYIIPDEFSIGGLVFGLLFSLPGGVPEVGRALLGASVGFGGLWAVGALGTMMFKKEAMGGGDIKMMAMVGAFVGWQGVLLTIFLGALLGSLIFVPLQLFRSDRQKEVPFGIFLSLGAATTYLIGSAIIGWYTRYLGAA